MANGDAFEIGKPLSVNFAWTVFGQKPAENIAHWGKTYLLDDILVPSQEKIVKDFQISWEQVVQTAKGKELPTAFPGDKAESFYLTAQGPVISERDKLAIKYGKKFVFVVLAARFKDSIGDHEAHMCRWLETHPSGVFGSVAWHDCDLWITQIDLNKE